MTWLKIDDGFCNHEKVSNLSHAAFRLHVSALCLCARDLTDGRISERNLKGLTAGLGISARRYSQELVDARLWFAHVKGGWYIKDYLDYNPSSVKVKEQRVRHAERQARYVRRRVTDGVTDGVTDDGPTRPVNKTELPTTLVPKDVTPTEDVGAILAQVNDSLRSI